MAGKPVAQHFIRTALVCLAGLLLANMALLMLLPEYLSKKHGSAVIKTLEPLLIESPAGDDHAYVLPAGTALYLDKRFPEGHERYVVYLNHKGSIAHDDIPMKPEYGGQLVEPLWVSNLEAGTSGGPLKRHPLSREDVIAAIKANEITRDELADIVRSQP